MTTVQLTVKIYEPTTAIQNFYCDKCHNLVMAGESCTTIIHPVEEEKHFPYVESICEECLFEEAE